MSAYDGDKRQQWAEGTRKKNSHPDSYYYYDYFISPFYFYVGPSRFSFYSLWIRRMANAIANDPRINNDYNNNSHRLIIIIIVSRNEKNNRKKTRRKSF